eukprot:TRINITY_DN2372_c0_g1_i10.p1 TRINITY_DN2372_c0_g1~~TRINITY_DN2372_c0_g1_i10.p1  ORF type:complete len:166 (+),score=11.16 TRINITY_DN2372_c0_g1_i10:157-654(+)
MRCTGYQQKKMYFVKLRKYYNYTDGWIHFSLTFAQFNFFFRFSGPDMHSWDFNPNWHPGKRMEESSLHVLGDKKESYKFSGKALSLNFSTQSIFLKEGNLLLLRVYSILFFIPGQLLTFRRNPLCLTVVLNGQVLSGKLPVSLKGNLFPKDQHLMLCVMVSYIVL